MRKLFTKDNVLVLILALIALHPFIELDYLFVDFFDKMGLVRPTMIIDYIILPLLVIITYFLFEKRKKQVLIFALLYGLVFGVYTLLHMASAKGLVDTLYLPDSFIFSLFYELAYMVVLVLPLVYVWVVYRLEVSEAMFKKISITIASLMGFSILIANLFEFGLTTYNYENQINGNIFSWFSMPYDLSENMAKFYPTKFYFEEGNTTSILMFINDCFIFYFFLKETKLAKKIYLGALCFVHSLSMMIVATKVATYGALLVPVMVLVVYIVLIFLHYERFKKSFVITTTLLIALVAYIIPYSPSYNMNIKEEITEDGISDKATIKAMIDEGASGLIKYSDEWFDYYTSMANKYHKYIESAPELYYEEYYPDTFDPYFWVELVFEKSSKEISNGRNMELYINAYKWQSLSTYQRFLGLGYTTFMNGSVSLERDFVRTYYAYGYGGFVLMALPWFIVWGALSIKLLLSYRDHKWTMFNVLLMASISMAILVGLISGHAFDELSTSLFVALSCGVLWRDLYGKRA